MFLLILLNTKHSFKCKIINIFFKILQSNSWIRLLVHVHSGLHAVIIWLYVMWIQDIAIYCKRSQHGLDYILIIPVCKRIRFSNKWGRFNLFTLELYPSKKPFVKWKSFSSSAMLYNFPFLYRAPSVAVKRPPVCSIGPIVLMFPGHICQVSLVSCHSDLSNYFPIWGQRDRWNKTQMDWQSGWIWKWNML